MKNSKSIFITFIALIVSVIGNAQPNFGEDAYEIVLPSGKGDTVKLSSLKGKIVLLDFWASWCGPCRASNRDMVKLYKKHKDKGFEILGVSIDDEEKHWKKAIIKDKITWLQVIDPGGWEARTAMQWNLNAIPANYLIDKEGKVIGMDLEVKDLEKALQQLLTP